MHPDLAKTEPQLHPEAFDTHREMSNMEEHLLLRSTAREVLGSSPTPAEIAALGWLGLLTSERAGGEGWFPYEASLVVLEGGRVGTSSTWYLGALAAAFTSHATNGSEWTDGLLSGDLVGTYAYAPDMAVTEGTVSGIANSVLSDRPPDITVFASSPSPDSSIVAVEQKGAPIHADRAGLETERSLYRLTLEPSPASVIEPQSARALSLLAIVLLCADTVGTVGRAMQIVSDYLVDREAFDVPIASFQVIQHRLVNLATFYSASEALVLSAATAVGEEQSDAERLALAAHAYIEGRAIRAVDDCIQLAGGIGFTWEFPLHHALRRTLTNAALLGSGRASRQRLAEVKGRTG